MDVGRPVDILTSIQNANTSIFCLKFNSDDSFLAYGNSDGKVSIVDSTCEKIQNLELSSSGPMPVSSLNWHRGSQSRNLLLTSSSEGVLSDWHAVTGKEIHTFKLPYDDYGACCDFAPNGDFFALGCKEGRIRIFDDSSKQETLELKKTVVSLGHNNLVLTVKWSSNNVLFSGSMDGSVIMWDTRTGSVCKYFSGFAFYGDSLDVLGDCLLTADTSTSEQVKVWSIGQERIVNSLSLGTRIRPFRAYTAQFCKSGSLGNVFVGGNGSVQGYFVDAGTCEVLGGVGSFQHPIFCCDFCNMSGKIAVGTSGGLVSSLFLNMKGAMTVGVFKN